MDRACPKCNVSIADDPTLWGKNVACASCGTVFQFPFPDSGRSLHNPYSAPQVRLAGRRSLHPKTRRLPQSGPGMGAFVIGFFGFVWLIISFVSAYKSIRRHGDIVEEFTALAAWLLLHALWATLGLGLGIVGSFQHDRNPIFAYVGIVLNAVPLAFVAYLLMR